MDVRRTLNRIGIIILFLLSFIRGTEVSSYGQVRLLKLSSTSKVFVQNKNTLKGSSFSGDIVRTPSSFESHHGGSLFNNTQYSGLKYQALNYESEGLLKIDVKPVTVRKYILNHELKIPEPGIVLQSESSSLSESDFDIDKLFIEPLSIDASQLMLIPAASSQPAASTFQVLPSYQLFNSGMKWTPILGVPYVNTIVPYSQPMIFPEMKMKVIDFNGENGGQNGKPEHTQRYMPKLKVLKPIQIDTLKAPSVSMPSTVLVKPAQE